MDGKHTYLISPRTLIFLKNGDDILLLKRGETRRLFPGKWNGIGGHIEPGEDIYDSALREVLEETGLKAPKLTLAGLLHAEEGNPGQGVIVFIFIGESPERRFRDSEEGRLEWIPQAKAARLDGMPDLLQLLTAILAADPKHFPLFMRCKIDETDRLAFFDVSNHWPGG
jgi:8-oxo-dGTP diphosphatase